MGNNKKLYYAHLTKRLFTKSIIICVFVSRFLKVKYFFFFASWRIIIIIAIDKGRKICVCVCMCVWGGVFLCDLTHGSLTILSTPLFILTINISENFRILAHMHLQLFPIKKYFAQRGQISESRFSFSSCLVFLNTLEFPYTPKFQSQTVNLDFLSIAMRYKKWILRPV